MKRTDALLQIATHLETRPDSGSVAMQAIRDAIHNPANTKPNDICTELWELIDPLMKAASFCEHAMEEGPLERE
jgi:hypothetical protein